ncbi:MAG: Ger(x)C family spore germination protein [Tissierellia bacterium]|nr:Ger(x)C family spore germination protein [Tissierellia bacterium]
MKKATLILLIISMVLTTGCWDMLEVDQRIYPYTAGYDLLDKEKEIYNITFSYPNLTALGKNAVSEDLANIKTIEAENIFEAMHNISTELQYSFYFKHLKAIILSEEVALQEKLMRETVDGIFRDFTANKNLEMLLVKGSARQVLEAVKNTARIQAVEGVLNSMLENLQKSALFTPKKLGEFIFDMDICGTSVIPIVQAKEDGVEISGGAVFKDYKLVGYITGTQNRDIAYLRNEIDNFSYTTKYKGNEITLMLTDISSKPKLIEATDKIKIKMEVKLEAHIHSYIIGKEYQINTKEILKDIENQIAKEHQAQFKNTIGLFQKEYKADILEIGDYLYKFHPKLWKKVKEDWDKIYPEIEIDFDVEVAIRRRGLTK